MNQKFKLEKLTKIDDSLITLEDLYLETSYLDEEIENPKMNSIPEQMFKITTNFTRDQFKILFSNFDADIAKLENKGDQKLKFQ